MPRALSELTAEQQKLAAMVALGWSNQQIAGVTGITEGAVKNKLGGVYRETGIFSRLELALAVLGYPTAR